MKLSLRTLLVIAFMSASSCLFAAEKPDAKEAPSAVGSIRPKGEIAAKDLPALAKISFTAALEIALKTAPGAVIKAELEIEDGNLLYSFEIVGADKAVTEVEIDAGNGKVLGIDKG